MPNLTTPLFSNHRGATNTPRGLQNSAGCDFPCAVARASGIVALAGLQLVPQVNVHQSTNRGQLPECNMSLYTPLDSDKSEIRLLSIVSPPESDVLSLEFHTCSLEHDPRFFALSYTWGDASITDTVVVNGLPLQVTTNLVEALKVLNGKPNIRIPLWVDAICINQDNIAEKNAQVPLMSRIYASADMVIAWLGPEANDSSVAIEFINRLAQDSTMSDVMEDSKTISLDFLMADGYTAIANRLDAPRDLLQSITALMSERPYWTRRWTFQELVLSKRCALLCGQSSVLLSRCRRVGNWLHLIKLRLARLNMSSILGGSLHPALTSFAGSVMTLTAHMLEPLREVGYYAQFLDGTLSDKEIGGIEYLPLTALHITRGRQTTDPRDCLYAVADLADLGFKIDYALSTRQVYERFAAAQVNSIGDLSQMLQWSGIGRSNPDHVTSSWVPDWNWLSESRQEISLRATQPANECPYHANLGLKSLGGSQVESTERGLKLITLGVTQDTVQEVCPITDDRVTKTSNEINSQALDFVLSRLFSQGSFSPSLGSGMFPDTPPNSILLSTILISNLESDLWARKPLDTFSSLISSAVPSATILLIEAMLNSESTSYSYLDQLAINTARTILDQSPGSWKELVTVATQALGGDSSYLAFSKETFADCLCFGRYGLVPFTTTSGLLGATRANVLPGDLVCVISASAIPVVLRRVGDDYAFVSLCFIPQIMHGEVKAMDENGTDITQEFGII